MIGFLTFLPLGFLPGFVASWLLKKAGLLRVPPEVELEGLDMAEFEQDFYPEFGREPEFIITPEGFAVPSGPILQEDYERVLAASGADTKGGAP